jgi:hypothetical protein
MEKVGKHFNVLMKRQIMGNFSKKKKKHFVDLLFYGASD